MGCGASSLPADDVGLVPWVAPTSSDDPPRSTLPGAVHVKEQKKSHQEEGWMEKHAVAQVDVGEVRREANLEARRRQTRLHHYGSPFLVAPGVSSHLDAASGEYICSHAGREWASILSTAPLTVDKPSISLIVLSASPSGGGLSLGLSPPDCPLSSGTSHPAGLDAWTVGCTPYLGLTWQSGGVVQQQQGRANGSVEVKEGDVFTMERVDTMALAQSEQNAAAASTTDRRSLPSTPSKATLASSARPATTIIFTHNTQELARCSFPYHPSADLPDHLQAWWPLISLACGVRVVIGRPEERERVKGEAMRRADHAARWMQTSKRQQDAAEEQSRLHTIDHERLEREISTLTEELRLTSASEFQKSHLSTSAQQREATLARESAARARYDAIHSSRLAARQREEVSHGGMELGGRTNEEEKLMQIKHAQEDDLWASERAAMEAELAKQRQSSESALKSDESTRLSGDDVLRQRQIELAQVGREQMERRVRWEEMRRARQARADQMVQQHQNDPTAFSLAFDPNALGRAIPTSLRDSVYSVPPRRELLTSGIYLLHRTLAHPILGDLLSLEVENRREEDGVLVEIDLGRSTGLEWNGTQVQRAMVMPRATEMLCFLTPAAVSSSSSSSANQVSSSHPAAAAAALQPSHPSSPSPLRAVGSGGYSLKYSVKLETREVDQEQREARIRIARAAVQQSSAATKQLNIAHDAAMSDLLVACSTSLPRTPSGVSIGWCDSSFPPGFRSLGLTNEQAARKGIVWRRATTMQVVGMGANVHHFSTSASSSFSSLHLPPVLFGPTVDPMEIESHDWDAAGGGGAAGEVLAGIFAVLASRPSLLERIFATSTPSALEPSGVYSLQLCLSGRWTPVVVDDYLPCFAESGLTAYLSVGRTTGAIWPALLEKALAKVFGSYSALSRACSPGGESSPEVLDALFQTLTGGAVKSLSTRGVPAKQPQAIVMTTLSPVANAAATIAPGVTKETAGGPQAPVPATTQKVTTNGATPTAAAAVTSSKASSPSSPRPPIISVSEPLWALLQKEAASEQLLWATTLSAEELSKAAEEVKAAFARFALRCGCAYPLARVVQLPASHGGGARLVQIFNGHSLPNASGGAWSDSSSLWTKEVRQLVRPGLDSGRSGLAWMEYSTALGVFSRVSSGTIVSPRSLPFHSHSFLGRFTPALPFAADQMYTLDLAPGGHSACLQVTLDQQGGLDALREGRPVIDLGLLLVSRDPKSGGISRILFDTPLTASNQIVAACVVTPGQYLLLPYTSGTAMLQHLGGREMPYTLTVRCDTGLNGSDAPALKVMPIPSDPMLLDSAVVVALSQRPGPPARVEGLSQGLTLITGDGDGGRLRSYAVRLSPQWTESVTVSIDCSSSVNTSSHRGGLSYTHTLAPGDAVLFHHLTPTTQTASGWTIEADIQWQ